MRNDCEACGSVDHVSVYCRSALVDIVSCRGCGLVWNRAMLARHEQVDYYSSEYRTQWHGSMNETAPFSRSYLISMLSRAACVEEFLRDELLPGQRHLDIGCGEGTLLALSRSRGLAVTGLELDARLTQFARQHLNLTVLRCTLETLDAPRESFDLLSLVHVAEHLPHPIATLRQAAAFVPAGGLVYVEVPNLFEPWQRPRTFFFREHSFYFSANSLRRIVALAGFQPIRLGTSRRDGSVQLLARKDASARVDPTWRDEPAAVLRSIAANQRSYWLGLRYFRNKLRRLRMKRWALARYGHLLRSNQNSTLAFGHQRAA